MASTDVGFAGTERFEIVRRLGAGGMGVVYEAYDRDHDARVALKTLRHVDAQSIYRFKKEFHALQDIEHPNLVHLGELVCVDNVWFFTMEYVDGVDLLTYVRPKASGAPSTSQTSKAFASTRRILLAPADEHDLQESVDEALSEKNEPGPPGRLWFDEGRLRASFGQLATAMAALHDTGCVHRDIKPSNVLVTKEGRVVLLDFGLVSRPSQRESTQESTAGTAAYMAPEQAATGEAGPEADWYAFGVVLYEALTGRLPYSGRTDFDLLLKKQQYEPAPPRARIPNLPRDLDALCADLLRLEPQTRPRGAAVLERLGVDDAPMVPSLSTATSRFTQSIPFVGRENELAMLRQAYRDAVGGHAVTAFVHGDSGVGKSELVRRFLDLMHAENDELVVLAGRCYERASVPYKAFDGVADALSRLLLQREETKVAHLLPRRAALLPQLFPVLQRVPAIANAPIRPVRSADPQELRRRMFGAFQELLARLTEWHPLILFVDDFQWADADSLVLLQEIMHPDEAPPLLLVATVRSTDDGERERIAVQALDGADDVRHLRMEALADESARNLVTLLAPKMVADNPDLPAEIARETGGHPLFIQELIHQLEDERSSEGLRLDDALWSRINQLPPPERGLLELLCVADAPISRDVARDASGMEYERFDRAASLLRVAFLVRSDGSRGIDKIEPYHGRISDAFMAHIGLEEKKSCHTRLGVALERAGAGESEPQALVRHFAAAEEPARAARHAKLAAERASAALAFDQAAEHLRTCLELGTFDADSRRTLQIQLGQALINAGRGPEAADVLLHAAAGADPATRLNCQRMAAEQLLTCGHIEAGLSTLRELLSELGVAMPSTPRRALISLLWNRFKLRLRGLHWKERHETEVAERDLVWLDVYKGAAHGLGLVDNVRGADFQSRGLLLALRAGERSRVGRALALEAIFHATQGTKSLARARSLHETTRKIAAKSEDPYLKAWERGTDGTICLYEGRFADATRIIPEGVALMRDVPGALFEVDTLGMFHRLALRFMGDIEGLRAMSEESLRDATRRGDRHTMTTTRRQATQIWLARDDVDGARANLEKATWVPPEGVFHLQHWYEIEAIGELEMYANNAERGFELCEESLEMLFKSLTHRVQRIRVGARWLQARLALATASGAHRDRLKIAKRAARRLAKEHICYADTWARMVEAAIADHEGDESRAERAYRAAIQAAQQSDMLLCAECARYRLGELLADERAVATARADIAARGIVAPGRMVQIHLPRSTRSQPSG